MSTPSSSSQQPYLPPPPRLHWGWVLGLGMITGGLFLGIWMFIQSGWVQRVRGKSRAQLFIILWAASFAISFFYSMAVLALGLRHLPVAVLFPMLVIRLLGVASWIIGIFVMRSELEAFPIGLSLNGIITFFLGPSYFQYHLQEFDNVTSPEDRLAQTDNTPAPLRYEEMQHHELIHLLDEVNDERARARFRESVYLSIIVWLVLLLVLRYGPHYLWKQPHVITEIRPDEQKQFTMLNLPPDMVKKIPRIKPAPQIAERDQVGQSPQPAPTPPQPAPGERSTPAPQQDAPQPQQQAAPPTQQQAHTQTPPPPQPKPQQTPLIDTPRPSPQQATRPNFNTGSVSEQMRQAARGTHAGASTQYGDYGNGPTRNGSQRMGTQILSDTQGVDFGKYLQRLLHDIKRNWDPLIPEECKPPIMKQGITDVRFTINRDGSIAAMNLDMRSGDVAIDRSAWGAITSLGQAQPLPPEFKGPNLVLRIEFRVNKDMDAR